MRKPKLTAAEERAYRRLAHAAREVQRLAAERKERAKIKTEQRQAVTR